VSYIERKLECDR